MPAELIGTDERTTMKPGCSTRRRRSASDPTLRHDPALKALAIRTGRIHVMGAPTLTMSGTPVYFDVEGIPDRGFYYLVGLRFGLGGAEVQNSS